MSNTTRRVPRRASAALAALLLGATAVVPGCIGNFALTKEVWTRNSKIESKVGREALFLALLIVPVYEIAVLADMLVFNAVELFSDENVWETAPPLSPDAEP